MYISFLQILPEPFYAGVYHQLLGKPDIIQHFQSQAGMPHLSGKMGIRIDDNPYPMLFAKQSDLSTVYDGIPSNMKGVVVDFHQLPPAAEFRNHPLIIKFEFRLPAVADYTDSGILGDLQPGVGAAFHRGGLFCQQSRRVNGGD